MLKITTLSIAILLSGCSAKGPVYETAPQQSLTNQSEVILFRIKKFAASGSAPCTKVNGNSYGLLKNSGFLRIPVNPGSNVISMPLDDVLTITLDTAPKTTT
mgnify:CR=1 FL=1